MPDKSDSVALTRAFAKVGGDVDAEMSFYGPDPVYDLSAMGIGIFEGRSAIRAFLEGWMNTYESYEEELQEIRDLGGGMAFCVIRESARPRGSDANTRIQSVYAFVVLWVNGKIARLAAYPNLEDGRAAAERLAELSEPTRSIVADPDAKSSASGAARSSCRGSRSEGS